jgi:hypothetical protein
MLDEVTPRTLSLDELDARSADFDAHVAASADVDRFCSSSDWIVPAARALMPPAEVAGLELEGGYAALARFRHAGGWVRQPLEAMWGLACPVVGHDVEPLSRSFAQACALTAGSDALLLCGLVAGSPRLSALVRALMPWYELRRGPITRRFVADLTGGEDAFLSRRSPALRRNLRSAARKAASRGVTFEPCAITPANAEDAYERLLRVEAQSWKGEEGVGIAAGMEEFYRLMVKRLARRGGARLLFARAADADVAYVLGGLFGDTYRGLQFAQARRFEDCALGNLGQLAQVRALAAEGIRFYDLGSEVDYKKRWGEIAFDTVTVLALPR